MNERDLGSIQAAGADQVEIRPVGEGGEDVERVGQDGQRQVGEKFGERQDGGAGIEENRLVRLDAARGEAGDG